jgi:hypothetical protein
MQHYCALTVANTAARITSERESLWMLSKTCGSKGASDFEREVPDAGDMSEFCGIE